MKAIDSDPTKSVMGRRTFVTRAAALGAGVGLSAPLLAACADDTGRSGPAPTSSTSTNRTSASTAEAASDVASRDQDLKLIGVEETFSTPELMQLNSLNQDHIDFLSEIGLANLGERRIGDMDEGGLDVQILSAHTPSVQNVPGQEGIDFAYRLNRLLVEGPIASYPAASRPSPRCRCKVRRQQRTSWNARFETTASSAR